MGARSRPVDRGTERGRRLRVAVGGEIRAARVDRDLTLREVSQAVGVSVSTGSRVERGLLEPVDLMLLARLCAVARLDLSVRTFPGGQPIRDSAHLRLLADLRAMLHPSAP